MDYVTGITQAEPPTVISTDAEKDMNKVVPCDSCCCYIDSCFCLFPQCLGCARKEECCCLACDSIYYKPQCGDTEREDQDVCCILQKGAIWIQWPTTCLKTVDQCCCIDHRCAFPCDKEVPCLCMCLPFCTCCVNCACGCYCCATIETMTGAGIKPRVVQQQPTQTTVIYVNNPSSIPQ